VYVKQHPVASHVFHKIHLVPIPTSISPILFVFLLPTSIPLTSQSFLFVMTPRYSQQGARPREVMHATLRRNPVALPGLSRDHLATTFLTFLITVPIEIIARLQLGIIESTYDLS